MKHKAFHVTNINNKKELVVLNVCEDCLGQIDINEKTTPTEANAKTSEEQNKILSEYRCDFCKLSLEELLKTSRIGCENCYKVFEKPLTMAFEKMQRTPEIKELKHVGSIPTQWKKRQAKETDPKKFLLELKQNLALLTREEKYEKCKDIKDKIYAFEFLIKKVDEFENDQDQKQLILEQIYEFIYKHKESEE